MKRKSVDWEDLGVTALVTFMIGGPIGYMMAALPLYWLWPGFRPDSAAQFVVISAIAGGVLALWLVMSELRR